MSLAEDYHAAHKARLERMSGVKAAPIAELVPKVLLDKYEQELRELRTRNEHQQEIISELNATIAKQRLIIRQFADESESPMPRISDVVAVVAEHYNLTKAMIIGPQRASSVTFPRQVGYHICRDLGFGWLAIGRGFMKDHSSALHGSRQISERMAIDPALVEEIESIKIALDKYVARRNEASRTVLA